MTKAYRHGQILNLIRTQSIRTQEEMAQALQRVGVDVTQVTLSRDIHELGLVKGARGYREPERSAAPENEGNSLKWMLKEFVRDVITAQNFVIIKTASGNAQPVAEAVDREAWPEIVGTIAGENTVFAATPDPRQAARAKEKLLALLR
jgi:transcriptional regulator of arginine metabolism